MAKVLDDLADRGLLMRKDNKKQKIYWGLQEEDATATATATAEDSGELDARIAGAKQRGVQAKARADELATRVRDVGAQPTDSELAAALAQEAAECERLQARADALRRGGARVCPEEKKKATALLEKNIEAWRKRKRLVRNEWCLFF